MNLYRCYLFGKDRSIPSCTTIQSNTHAQARKLAMQILRDSPHVQRLEAWCRADLAFRLNRHNMIVEAKAEQCRTRRIEP